MSKRTGVRYHYASHDRTTTRKAKSQNAFGGIALAAIVGSCVWTLYANVFGAGIYPAMASANFDAAVTVEPRSSVRRISFADRFEPAATAPLATPQKPNVYVALYDPTYSLKAPADMFSTDARPKFERRLMALALPADDPAPLEVAPPPPPVIAAVQSIPLPMARPAGLKQLASVEIAKAKSAVIAAATGEKLTIFEKLYGKPQSSNVKLAFASADGGVDIDLSRNLTGAIPLYDRSTAVYDITARTVYLPNGTKLEAHSGLGPKMDDPRFVHVRMHGATPPHIYDLKPREALFHGVPALRLTPVGGEQAIHGRTGLLAHTYMLGPNGDSNGCVSFKDYYAFLRAYRNGEIKKLAVVARVE